MQPPKERLDWLQGLRGIAAIGVVVCHARFFLQSTPYFDKIDSILKSGESGVDLFFVISGFIMAVNLHGKGGGLRSAVFFLLRRFARIWPAYAAITALTLLFNSMIGAHPTSIRDVLRTVFFIPVHYSGLYLEQYMSQGWTLTYEAYFYLVLAICITCGRLIWAFFALWTTGALLIIPIILHSSDLTSPFLPFLNTSYAPRALAVMCNPIIWEFVGGIFAGLMFRSRIRFGNSAMASVMLFGSIFFSAAIVLNVGNTHGITQWGMAYVQLVLVTSIASKTIKIELGQTLTHVGGASYTLYITHLLTFDIFNNALNFAGYGFLVPSVGYVIVMITVCIMLALASHRALERDLSSIVFNLFQSIIPQNLRSMHKPLEELGKL